MRFEGAAAFFISVAVSLSLFSSTTGLSNQITEQPVEISAKIREVLNQDRGEAAGLIDSCSVKHI